MIRTTFRIACLVAALTPAGLWLPVIRAQDAIFPAAAAQLNGPVADSPERITLRNLHRFEKAFLTRACQLSEEQKREVNKLDLNWTEAVPKPQAAEAGGVGVANALPALLRGRIVARPQVIENTITNASDKYRKSLRAKFGELLTPEQREVYEKELAAHDQFKPHVDAACLVAALEDTLGLLPEQREPLTKALAGWPGKDGLYIAYYLQREGTLPQIPDALLTQHLTREQMSIYRQAQKIEVRMGQNQGPEEEGFGE